MWTASCEMGLQKEKANKKIDIPKEMIELLKKMGIQEMERENTNSYLRCPY